MYPSDYFSWIPYLHIIAGIHNPKNYNIIPRILIHTYNFFFAVLCYVYYTPAEWAMLSVTSKNINNLIDHIGMISTHNIGLVKLFVLFKNWSRVNKIITTLDSDEFKYEECKGVFRPGDTVVRARTLFRMVVMAFAIVGTLVPVLKCVDAFWKYFQNGHLVDEGTITCASILPYYSWFPFEVESTRRCGWALFLQFWPMTLYVYPIIATDLTYAGMVLSIRGQFIIIKGAFLTLRQRCLAKLHLPEDYDCFNDELNPILETEIRNEVRKITIHLQKMISLVDEIESIYNFQTLLQVISLTFSIVSCLYIISNEPIMSPISIAESQYLLGMLIQLFTISSFGDEITSIGSDIFHGISGCDWIPLSKSVKSSLIINMMRLQKPIRLTMCKFSPLTLNTFVQIMKVSYTYFTYIQNNKE